MRSVLTVIITRVGGSIARNPQITACRMGGSACFAGLFWTSTCSRSVRAVCSPHDR